jgi:hypothetical protein
MFAIRSVCCERLLSTNQVELRSTIRWRRQPIARLDGISDLCQWWLPNAAGHRQMVLAAGFEIERDAGLYSEPFGVAHSPRPWTPSGVAARLARRLLTGSDGVPHHALLARPVA